MKYNRMVILIMSGLLMGSFIHAQTLKAFTKAADDAFAKKDYYSSLVYNLNALEFDSTKLERIHAAAESARLLNSYKVAEALYEKVISADKKDKYSADKFYLAQMQQALGKYTEAKSGYSMYVTENKGEDAYLTQKSDKEIKACDWSIDQINRTMEDIKITRLGDEINTGYSEFGAVRQGDSIIYSSLRFEKPNSKIYPNKTYSNLLLNVKGINNESINTINNPTQHTAHTAINSKNNRMYYTLCEYLNASDIRCDLYYRDYTSTGYSDAKKLPYPINVDGYTSTQPNVGLDPISQKEILYWVSDRKEGKGKLDIWYATVEGDTTFGTPQNLAAVNTAENDITPFYDHSANELYFSTDGRIGLGGYDVYKAANKKGTWLEVEHMGVPINSSYHDIYYTISADGKKGLMSSNRVGSQYLDALHEACCYDIYDVSVEPIIIKLHVTTFDKNTLDPLKSVTIRIKNLTLPNLPDIVLLNPDGNTFESVLDRNRDYQVVASKPGYRPDSTTVSTYGTTKSIDLDKKMYLETDTIALDVFTFDKKTQAALQGTEVTIMDISDANKVILNKINPSANDFHTALIRGHIYRIIANKKGYNPSTATIDTKETKANKIKQDMYLDIGDIYSFLPLVLYFDNDQPDIRSYKPRTDKKYSETYPPYYARKEEFKDIWASKLKLEEISKSDQNYENFFNDRLKKGREDLDKFLDILISMMERGDHFEIFLKGYASPRANEKYNLILSQRRIFSVKNELLRYRGGIISKYLDNKQLAISEKPFGEFTSPKGVPDNLKDTRQSVFGIGASNERRVEIVDVKKNK